MLITFLLPRPLQKNFVLRNQSRPLRLRAVFFRALFQPRRLQTQTHSVPKILHLLRFRLCLQTLKADQALYIHLLKITVLQ